MLKIYIFIHQFKKQFNLLLHSLKRECKRAPDIMTAITKARNFYGFANYDKNSGIIFSFQRNCIYVYVIFYSLPLLFFNFFLLVCGLMPNCKPQKINSIHYTRMDAV